MSRERIPTPEDKSVPETERPIGIEGRAREVRIQEPYELYEGETTKSRYKDACRAVMAVKFGLENEVPEITILEKEREDILTSGASRRESDKKIQERKTEILDKLGDYLRAGENYVSELTPFDRQKAQRDVLADLALEWLRTKERKENT